MHPLPEESIQVESDGRTIESLSRKAAAIARARRLGRRHASVIEIRRTGEYETRQKIWLTSESIYSNGRY